MLIAAPIAAALVCLVWLVALRDHPMLAVWQLAGVVFGVYLGLAAVAWITSRMFRRKPR